ncbi:MAG: DUF4238 domain-containing protein [Planctomycetota bacterium]
MSTPRKHHYLPQFYLKRWASPRGQLFQIEKDTTARVHKVSVKDAAAARDYHALDCPGVKDPNELEKRLSSLESENARTISTILLHRSVLDEMRHDVAALVSVFRVRVPGMKRAVEAFLKQSVKSVTKQMKRAGKLPELVMLENEHGITDEQLDVKVANQMVVAQMYSAGCHPESIAHYARMEIGACLAPEGTSFVTGDQPVAVFLPFTDLPSPNDLPMLHRDVRISMPLSPKISLELTWAPQRAARVLSTIEVAELNRRTVVMSEKYVFAADDSQSTRAMVRENGNATAGFIGGVVDCGSSSFSFQRIIPVLLEEYYRVAHTT